MTAMATTIIMITMVRIATTISMPKRERERGDPKRVNQTCTEVVLRGPGNGFGTRRSTHPRGENRSPGRVQNPGYGNFWTRTDFWTRKTTHPWEAKSWEQNPSYGFGTRKTTHSRGPKSGGAESTDFGLGKLLTHGGQNSAEQNPSYGFGTRKTSHIEDPQTQALFRENR